MLLVGLLLGQTPGWFEILELAYPGNGGRWPLKRRLLLLLLLLLLLSSLL